MKDFIYQQFKYDFSLYVNEYFNKSCKRKIIDCIKNPQIVTGIQINKLKNLISSLMEPIISEKTNKFLKVDNGLYLGACYKSHKKQCLKNKLCSYEGKTDKCNLNMDEDYLDLFSYLLANDLNNNILERESVLNGIYIPSPFISNNIFNRKDDIIFHDYDIKNLKQYFFSKYQSNYELSNYETTDEKVLLDNTSIQNR